MGGRDRPIFAVPKLLLTPRLLKHTLRRMRGAWQALHGEIDFDDLLMVNVLRSAAPEAFDFVHYHIHELRQAENGKLRSVVQATNQPTSAEDTNTPEALYRDYIKKVSWNAKAAYDIIEILFP